MHPLRPAACQAGPQADSALPPLHWEIHSNSDASQGSEVLVAVETLVTLPATPASSALMQNLQKPTGKSKQAGYCSAHDAQRLLFADNNLTFVLPFKKIVC